MIISNQNIFQAGELLWQWTVRNIRARYQQSILGWVWAVVQPVASVAIFSIVFTRIVPVDTAGIPYVIFSYVAVAPWTLLTSSITDMVASLVQNMNLIGKIYFPREILPIAALLARLADFGVSFIILIGMMLIYRIEVTWLGLLYLPIVLLIQIFLILGLGIGFAALNVFYRDVDPLLKLIIQVWFYASPILYPVSLVPKEWQWLYFLNPMAGIIAAYRDVLIYNTLPGNYLLASALISLIILVLGYWYFKRVEFQFADII